MAKIPLYNALGEVKGVSSDGEEILVGSPKWSTIEKWLSDNSKTLLDLRTETPWVNPASGVKTDAEVVSDIETLSTENRDKILNAVAAEWVKKNATSAAVTSAAISLIKEE